jgi:predicted RNase H-like HicB family nuclease
MYVGNQKMEKKMKVNIVIEKDMYGYYAYCPELNGCHSQGDSLEEALSNIKEAVELYLETLSTEEKQIYLSKEILTTSMEIQIA